MASVTAGAIRQLRAFLLDTSTPKALELEKLLPRGRTKKAVPGGTRKELREAKYSARGTKIAEIRQAVFQRAKGTCEACRCRAERILDHWLGGSGRRRELESVETTWSICGVCHRDRTNNHPSAAYWNKVFQAHCYRHKYPFTPHVEKQAVRP